MNVRNYYECTCTCEGIAVDIVHVVVVAKAVVRTAFVVVVRVEYQ
jgi:hypothetical protein